jgi:predicted ATPase/DNA-binding XRE family transcriptional regulator
METRDPLRFGDLLRRHRTAAALSQEALAERAGLSVRGLSDLERGVHRAPRLETVRLLAEALALSEDDRAGLLAVARPDVDPESTEGIRPSPLVSLPRPPTRLIGREAELMAVADLLAQDDVHLVTLTGPGGTGKTRLAQAVAAAAMGHYPDGVCVDLSALTDPALVVPTIATAVGAREIPETPLRETVIRHLRDRRLLLVLDNCEQVLGAASDVAALLAACHDLAILATSREPLHIRAEREVAVAPLPLPDPSVTPSLDALERSAAVALFVERARAVSAGFALTADNAAAVAGICQRLDGLPLAIELAAARIKALPPAALLTRFEQRLPLLTGGSRDLPARQQTMRDTIAWSYDLLSPEEQALFRCQAVFAGGFTLGAVEAVCGNGDADPFEGVASLINKSLVREEGGPGEDPRYRMLETVREFGLEQLAASGEETAARRRHVEWALALAEQNWAAIFLSPIRAGWLDRVTTEHDNLRAALAWLERTGDAEAGLRLAGHLSPFWFFRGPLAEGQGWLERLLAKGGNSSAPVRARALFGLGRIAQLQGAYGPASAMLAESYALLQASGDHHASIMALLRLGTTTTAQGDYPRAAQLLTDALAMAREPGHEDWTPIALTELAQVAYGQAVTLTELAQVAYGQDDLVWATALAEEALALHQRSADQWGTAVCLETLALVASAQGDLAAAATRYRESLALRQAVGQPGGYAAWLAGVATLAAQGGHAELAARLFGATQALRNRTGDVFHLPQRETYERAEARARAVLGEAGFAAASRAGRMLPPEEAVAEALVVVDDLAADETDTHAGD